MQSTIPLVSTFSQFDSIQSDLISVFPVTRPLRFVHRELGLGHYGEILTRTFRILHLQRLHAKAIYPTSTIYYVILAHTKGWVLFVPFRFQFKSRYIKFVHHVYRKTSGLVKSKVFGRSQRFSLFGLLFLSPKF